MKEGELLYLGFFAATFLFLFAVVEFIYLKFKIPAELSRKFLHFSIGTVCAVFGFLFKNPFPLLFMTILFYIVLGFGKKYNFMQSIHGVKRKSVGGVLFPISIYLIFLLNFLFETPYYYFLISILILSISDPLAAIGGVFISENKGQMWKINELVQSKYKTKLGSLFFLISSSIIVLVGLLLFSDYSILYTLSLTILISVSSTFIEAISKKGWDNLFIPLGVWFILIVTGYS